MSTALKLAQSADNVVPLRPPVSNAEVAARRRPKIAHVQVVRSAAPPQQSRVRRVLVHVERLSECVAVGVITQVATLTLKAYGILS